MASPRIVPTGILGGISGKDGLDGSNVLPTDTAIKQAIENPASQTAAALSASIAEVTDPLVVAVDAIPETVVSAANPMFVKRQANTVVYLGDSISNFLGLTADGDRNATRTAAGYAAWADVLTGHRLNVLMNASTVGHTTAQMLARVGQVVAQGPAICHVLGGTNDVGSGVALATTIANLTAIYDALQAAGITVVVGTVPPRSAFTTPQRAVHDGINAWLRALPATRPDITVVDYAAALVGPDGNWARAEYVYDVADGGVHPTRRGAYEMGKALAAVIQRLVPARQVLPFSEGDAATLKTSRFLGAVGGSHVPNDGLGLSWTGTAGTLDYVTRTDGVAGGWWQVTVPAGSGADIIMNVDLPAGVPGTLIETGVEYKVSGIQQAVWNGQPQVGWELSIQGYAGAFTGLRAQDLAYYVDAPVGQDTPGNFPIFDHTGVMLTPPHLLTNTATLAQARIRLRGGMVMALDRWVIRKATQPVVALAS